MKTRILSCICMVLLASAFFGCAGKNASTDLVHVPAPVEEQAAAVERSPGSLYANASGSLFAPNKATRQGDILTVVIYEQASAAKEAQTSTGRSSDASLGIPKLFGIETSVADKNSNIDPSSLLSANSDKGFDGSGRTSRQENLSATLTTRVVEVYPNGNMKIEGSKTVRVNAEDQIIKLSGLVRQADITAHNMIDSKYILDAKIEYSGKGIVSRQQQPGWLARALDVLWPF